MNQDGAITLESLSTGGDISITTTRLSGASSADADISIGNVSSNGGSVHLQADGEILAAGDVSAPSIVASGASGDGDVTLTAATSIDLPG